MQRRKFITALIACGGISSAGCMSQAAPIGTETPTPTGGNGQKDVPHKSQEFPDPRYANFEYPESYEGLLKITQDVIDREEGRGALGNVEQGEKVLIITEPEQSKTAMDAIREVWSEKGVETVLLPMEDLSPVSFEPMSAFRDGWREVFWREQNAKLLGEEETRPKNFKLALYASPDSAKEVQDYLENHPDITAIFAGRGGGSLFARALGPFSDLFEQNWIYTTVGDIIRPLFPTEVQLAAEEKTLEPLPLASEVRITDPEGTNLSFELTPEEAKAWAEGAGRAGHLFMYPDQATGGENQVFAQADGVIAGTSNHMGFYPRMEAHLENGILKRVEGGGRFGKYIQNLIDILEDYHYPGAPEPGYHYLIECALGTDPWFVRKDWEFHNTSYYFPNVDERNRSGIIHWGFGLGLRETLGFDEFARVHGLPDRHGWHIHNYFITYEVKRRDTGEWVKLIDRGRLTALDDPEVREIASNYGNPENILSEKWIPAIPGINYSGDYISDYAQNPPQWVYNETNEIGRNLKPFAGFGGC